MQAIPLKTGHTLTIRQAAGDDAERIITHYRQVGGESDNLPFGADEYQITVENQTAMIESMNGNGGLCLIAEVEGNFAGLLTFAPGQRQRMAHVGEFGLTVEKAYWGNGIGTRLLQALLAWAEASGRIRKINLVVRADNASAIAVYQKLGFKIEGTLTRAVLIDGRFYDSHRMGIEIDPF